MTSLLTQHRSFDQHVSLQLDSLRGLSALAVLIGHSFQVFIAPVSPNLFPVFGLMAQAAVMIFFVLSGFLITKSITRNSARPSGFSIGSFARDRFNRIYPPLVFAIVLVVALFVLAPYFFPSRSHDFLPGGSFIARDGFFVGFPEVAGTLIFLNGFVVENISANGPLWSLSFEVWYYVVAGFIAWRPRLGLPIGIAILVGLALSNTLFGIYSIIWFAGAVVAMLHNHEINVKPIAYTGAISSGIMALAIGTLYCLQATTTATPSDLTVYLLVAFNLCSGLSFAAFLYLIVIGVVSFKPWLPTSSQYSYTLYVTHLPILLFIFGIVQPNILDRPLLSSITAALAFLLAITLAAFAAPKVENFVLIKKYRKDSPTQ
ncbi:acyltransferase family protein [Parasphingorhabdus sp.]|uniref:acyltransferase family protein n=1 Tax=Parasphingorhabdus sp. TaxID=2709688 RepID=UPI003A952FDD